MLLCAGMPLTRAQPHTLMPAYTTQHGMSTRSSMPDTVEQSTGTDLYHLYFK